MAIYVFTKSQIQFAQELARQTNLNYNVILAWIYQEENGGNAIVRDSKKDNNWLNIGVTDTGTFGQQNPAWQNPQQAADLTAAWLKGVPLSGFGRATSGILRILGTVRSSPAMQISTIQGSGWASSHYPNFQSVYNGISSGKIEQYSGLNATPVLPIPGGGPLGEAIGTGADVLGVGGSLHLGGGGTTSASLFPGTSVISPITGAASAISGAASDVGTITHAIEWPFKNWDRILEVLAGFVLLIVGGILIAKRMMGDTSGLGGIAAAKNFPGAEAIAAAA